MKCKHTRIEFKFVISIYINRIFHIAHIQHKVVSNNPKGLVLNYRFIKLYIAMLFNAANKPNEKKKMKIIRRNNTTKHISKDLEK